LLELFSREGVGTMVSRDPFENLRKATIDDVGGILNLITPLEQEGILVKRPRDKLEAEIQHFVVQERDNAIIACAALYPYPEDHTAELACLVVSPHYKRQQRGDALLAFMEQEARQVGIDQLFVLTTHTAQWFQERGFIAADLDALPVDRRKLYNHQRQSKVFAKQLD
jgi:amino-acid N-acetyltransferase